MCGKTKKKRIEQILSSGKYYNIALYIEGFTCRIYINVPSLSSLYTAIKRRKIVCCDDFKVTSASLLLILQDLPILYKHVSMLCGVKNI